jgi:hypothetical protein
MPEEIRLKLNAVNARLNEHFRQEEILRIFILDEMRLNVIKRLPTPAF